MGKCFSKEALPTELTHRRFVLNPKERKGAAEASNSRTVKNGPDPGGTSQHKDKNEEESSIRPAEEVVTDDRVLVCSDEPLEPSNLLSNDTPSTKDDPELNKENPPEKSEIMSSIKSPSSSTNNEPETEYSEEKPIHIMASVKIRQDHCSGDSQSDNDILPPSTPKAKEEESETSPKEIAPQSASNYSHEVLVDTNSKLEQIKQTILPIIEQSNQMDPVDPVRKNSKDPINLGPAEQRVNYEDLAKKAQEDNYRNLKSSYLWRPDEFLSQNLALSVQFVRNHEKDMETLFKRTKDTEDELREKLSKTKQHSIISNQLFQLVLDYVGYETKVNSITILEPIQPVEHYLANECIKVNRPEDVSNDSLDYSQLDAPLYLTTLNTTKEEGYVKLQCLDDYETLVSRTNPESSIGTPPDSPKPQVRSSVSPKTVIDPPRFPLTERALTPTRDHVGFHFIKSQNITTIEEQDEESEASDEDAPTTGEDIPKCTQPNMASNSNSAIWNKAEKLSPSWNQRSKLQPFPTTKELPIPQPSTPEPTPEPEPFYKSGQEEDLYSYGTNNPEKPDIAPGYFNMSSNQNNLHQKCFKKIEVGIDEIDEERKAKVFLHSRYFARDFKRKGSNLAIQIGVSTLPWSWDQFRFVQRQSRNELDLAKEDVSTFVPTVEIGFWPNSAINWFFRMKNKVTDQRTGVVYQWPQDHICKEAENVGCNLVPIGYMDPIKHPKKGSKEYTKMCLTWRVTFTKMENKIMRHWSQPKIRCYIFMMLFQKKLFQSNSGEPLLSSDHFRHTMFSAMEKRPVGKWREEDLGTTLKQLFGLLNHALDQRNLSNFFMPKQNMLDTMQPRNLLKAKEVLVRLQECFSSYFLWCIMHLKAEKNFYPMPDVRKLYKILVADETAIFKREIQPKKKAPREVNPYSRDNTVGKFEKKEITQQRTLKQIKESEEKRKKEEESKLQQQDMLDPTRPNYPLQTIEKFEQFKGGRILEFFIEHFIKMAETSNLNRCYGQGLMYVMHCENLARLKKELNPNFSIKMETAEKIEQLKQVTRGYGRDYWKLNWDPEDGKVVGSSFTKGSQRSNSHRKIPLPSLPTDEEVQRL